MEHAQELKPRRPFILPGLKSDTRSFFTLANGISLARLVLLFPLFIFLRHGERDHGNMFALLIMGIALLTDMLDGMIARLMKQVSEWGKVLDPLADKLWINFLGLFLVMPWRDHPLPWQFFALMLLRDVAIVCGAYYAYKRVGHVMPSNMFGKVTMVAEALVLIAYTVYRQPVFAPWLRPELLVWIVSVMIVASGLSYAVRLRELLLESPSSSYTDSPPPLKVKS